MFALEGDDEQTVASELSVDEAVAETAVDTKPQEPVIAAVSSATQNDSLPDLGDLILVQTSQSALQAVAAYEQPSIAKGPRRSEVRIEQAEAVEIGPLELIETKSS